MLKLDIENRNRLMSIIYDNYENYDEEWNTNMYILKKAFSWIDVDFHVMIIHHNYASFENKLLEEGLLPKGEKYNEDKALYAFEFFELLISCKYILFHWGERDTLRLDIDEDSFRAKEIVETVKKMNSNIPNKFDDMFKLFSTTETVELLFSILGITHLLPQVNKNDYLGDSFMLSVRKMLFCAYAKVVSYEIMKQEAEDDYYEYDCFRELSDKYEELILISNKENYCANIELDYTIFKSKSKFLKLCKNGGLSPEAAHFFENDILEIQSYLMDSKEHNLKDAHKTLMNVPVVELLETLNKI